ncbi:radical SAM family RiPP maturation amino acid epimerase [candidate division KSB3 bacterium]|uniref:Radical SAM family RiPP maturation amino acid epimerase n=1 Tax=candidate division KSB3 bacterium TaxID=2044937 RepID=A0A9D5JYS5_9BACT|nr:radical SAM family RiPP maturation amino acid epimerase [candidate division KSB3 bacterium]MBD3326747.1 radical SAM family RiPP maturation amino acid epimerase [candidate division KSB3 bacterium]
MKSMPIDLTSTGESIVVQQSHMHSHSGRPQETLEIPQTYAELLRRFSDQELQEIAQIKRVFEWVQGDPAFCQAVDTGQLPPAMRERLERIGIAFDLEHLAILWKSPERVRQYVEACRTGSVEELPQAILDEVASYPLFEHWMRFISLKQAYEKRVRRQILPVPQHPQFDAWRSRRIASVRSELGFYGYTINHPILSFELSDGCSVGCWFCAFATRKLTQNLEYADAKDFFQRVAQSCVSLFGKAQAAQAMLYCGTEPHDNPGYLQFVKDYTAITGSPPFTSTAVAHDPPWLREVIAFYRQGPYAALRISVLSKAMLLKIHDLYSSDELRDVELLMQMKDHVRPKVASGRILKEEEGLRARQDGHYLDGGAVPQGSIECMSGFLINMVNRTMQVISPCYSSAKWPYGYRIFDETSFHDADDFPQAIDRLITRSMPENPNADMPMRFRDDLVYRPHADGFDLLSPNQVHHFRGKALYGHVGDCIAGNTLTYTELCDHMLETAHFNLVTVIALIKKLFDSGLLDEVYRP